MKYRWLTYALMVGVLFSPRLASAQMCKSRDEPDRHSNDQRAGDRTQQAIADLLSQEGSRQALVGDILRDPALLEDFIDAIAVAPEWRALAREELDAARSDASLEGPSDRDTSRRLEERGMARTPRKVRNGMRDLLSDRRSREALMDVVLQDRELMRDLVWSMARHPEASTLMAERVTGKMALRRGPRPAERSPAGPSKQDAALYACPMHPEVTSGRPGACPKCGMTLRRVR